MPRDLRPELCLEGSELQVLALHSGGVRPAEPFALFDLSASVLLTLTGVRALARHSSGGGGDAQQQQQEAQALPAGVEVVGWQINPAAKKPGPQQVSLRAAMDPSALVAGSVELNLRLMRWRLLPELELEPLFGARCVLFGAGTLGCAVARLLLAWGVRKLALVDQGVVALSNPVRQSLFTVEHATGGANGAPRGKAEAARDMLLRVNPAAEVEALALAVPMPGHPVPATQRDEVRAVVERLEALIAASDVLFLLFDTREARWLPTLLGAKHQKVYSTPVQIQVIILFIFVYTRTILVCASPITNSLQKYVELTCVHLLWYSSCFLLYRYSLSGSVLLTPLEDWTLMAMLTTIGCELKRLKLRLGFFPMETHGEV